MDEKFYKEWFIGFAEGAGHMNYESRRYMLRCCAGRCADIDEKECTFRIVFKDNKPI
ncbi:MAG: hypothetical protein NC428_06855 [Clostridium sp.]|nr:hypothetical protein [Clostridium sp.]